MCFTIRSMGSALFEMLLTSYFVMSKFVTALPPRSLIAAMSYALAASSCVPGNLDSQCNSFHFDPLFSFALTVQISINRNSDFKDHLRNGDLVICFYYK